MITINGKKFVRNNKERVETLFRPGGTAYGFYKTSKRSVKFYDAESNVIAIINKWGVFIWVMWGKLSKRYITTLIPHKDIGEVRHLELVELAEQMAVKTIGYGDNKQFYYAD